MLGRVWSWVRSPQGIRIWDVLIAALLAVYVQREAFISTVGVLPGGQMSTVIAVAGAVVLVVRRAFPRTVTLVNTVVFVLVGVHFPLMFACYSMANQLGNRRSVWWIGAWSVAVLAVPWQIGFKLRWPASVDPATLLLIVTVTVVSIGFPVMVGLWQAQRRQLIAGLRERAGQAEREQDLRAANAVAEERTRIARELHDVVAHRVSLINVRAAAISVSTSGEVAAFAENIRETSATAMAEMRELMSVLRQGDELLPLRPQPTLDAVRELVEQAVRDGQRVGVELPEQLPELPGSTARAVYWLVRESLVNTAKHAPGAEVRVALIDQEGKVDVRVSNTAGALRAAPGPRSGFGLLGMRERVLLSGGELSVGSTPGNGFLVSASFPKENR